MIYHGDSMQMDIVADVIITEPLYLKGSKDYESYIRDILDTFKAETRVFFQPDWRPIPKAFDGWFVADVYTGRYHDYLLSTKRGAAKYTGEGSGRNPRPYEIMRPIVEDFSNPGDTIYDPFMGYGSTGRACEGREFIGVERLEEFYRKCEGL